MATCKVEKNTLQLNNKGFSLVELLVVVAIMAILTGGVITSFFLVGKSNVKKATNAINDAITLCREKAMTNAAEEWDVVVYHNEKGEPYVDVVKLTYSETTGTDAEGKETTIKTPNRIEYSSNALPSNVEIDIEVDGSHKKVDADHSISISFKQNGEVGIVRYYNADTLPDVSETTATVEILYSSNKTTTKSYCYINGTYKSKNERVILYYSTGRHKVEEV